MKSAALKKGEIGGGGKSERSQPIEGEERSKKRGLRASKGPYGEQPGEGGVAPDTASYSMRARRKKSHEIVTAMLLGRTQRREGQNQSSSCLKGGETSPAQLRGDISIGDENLGESGSSLKLSLH